MPERNADACYEQMSVNELFLEAASFERTLKTFLTISGYPVDLKYNIDARAVVEIIGSTQNTPRPTTAQIPHKP